MMDTPRTPEQTLVKARQIAIETGLDYVYVGNVDDPHRQSTYCPGCGELVIARRWHDVGTYWLDESNCRFCGHAIAGHFADKPGHWGTRRMPVDPAALLRSLEPEQQDATEAGN